MRRLAALFAFGLLMSLCSCAQDESDEARSTRESGGTIPWNRPEKWEGAGVMGSQMNQMNQ